MKLFAIFLAILLGEVMFADQKLDPVISRGIDVELLLKQKYQVPSTEEGVSIRNISELKLASPVDSLGYKLDWSAKVLERPGKFAIWQMEWNSAKNIHNEQVRGILVVGQNGRKDALTGLFEIMGGISMKITSSTYEVLPNGPGAVCFVMSGKVDKKDDDRKVQRKIWFCRDNIGVEVSCSGNTDLLPIAKAIDQAIQSSPVKRAEAKTIK